MRDIIRVQNGTPKPKVEPKIEPDSSIALSPIPAVGARVAKFDRKARTNRALGMVSAKIVKNRLKISLTSALFGLKTINGP